MATEQFRLFQLPGHHLELNITRHAYDLYVLTEIASPSCRIVAQEVLPEQEIKPTQYFP